MKEYLLKLGFKVDSIGFEYWLKAIKLYKENYWRYGFTMEFIYYEVAKLCNSTRSRVERAMRTASMQAKDNIRKVYNYDFKITNKTILQLICVIGVINNEK